MRRAAAVVGTALSLALLPAVVGSGGSPRSASDGSGFALGAAEADITPPSLASPEGHALDVAAFVPACGASEAVIHTVWPGRRLFAFEKPFVDLFGAGRYVPGDPYCDADGTHRYEAPYAAGGSGTNRWPLTSADADPAMNTAATTPSSPALRPDPIGAQAVVFELGGRRVAMVSVDSIGIFDSTMDQIRAQVHRQDPAIAPADVLISSTHDESAPDPIGLWGPDLSGEPSPLDQLNGLLPVGVSSGVDEYYMRFLVERVAGAVVAADSRAEPAALRLAVTHMPADTQSCWSSYPFVDTELVPVMQGVATGADAGRVLFTMVNVGTHDESLAFSGDAADEAMLSGDWTGRLRAWLESAYPGSVGMETAGLVGSVETPALYPTGTQVLDVPGRFHGVPGNPVDGCSSVYPEPLAGGGGTVAPVTDALSFVDAYGRSVADTAEAALTSSSTTTVVPSTLTAQTRSVCVQLENNLFAAAFAAGLFPDRPAYADPDCTTGLTPSGLVASGSAGSPATLRLGVPAFIRSSVGVLTVGPAQVAYSPGEVFPFTEVGGPVDQSQMPLPTDCYLPSPTAPTDAASGNYWCGTPLPMTPDVSAEMTTPFRFLAGLGQDMIGYLFPPGNFVGTQGETLETPWSLYEETVTSGNDRFGYGHADDPESVGPNAGLAVTQALRGLLAQDGTGSTVVPGLFVDAAGRLCDSPFPASAPEDTGGASGGSWVTGCRGFTGAVGVRVVEPDGTRGDILVGTAAGDSSGWATYLATSDTGTAGTAYPYSTATRGVVVGGQALLVDVLDGARALD